MAIAIHTTTSADTTVIVMFLDMLKLSCSRPKVYIELPELVESCAGPSLGIVRGYLSRCVL